MLSFRTGLRAVWLAASAALVAGCNLQQDVEVDLPPYPAQLVVECYLEPGQIPQLTVSETVPYLSAPEPAVPTDVTAVLIGPNGQKETLRFLPGQNPTTRKYFTHIGRRFLSIRPGDTWQLDVTDTKGRHVTGTATMPTTVPIDSIEWKFNDAPPAQRRALVLMKFRDPAATADFYRFQIHRNLLLDSLRALDRDFEDRLFNGQQVPMGTSYEFSPNDTLLVTFYHNEQAYYNFLRSVDDAQNANGNPFGQPAQVQSTVKGGLGVFTILNYQRKQIILR
ncbi:DUF4249 domain-containing protein [Hymenobacter busanensis]|uniref:DUF4249 domain-containing protein n=1 Tax=Hymenobacter busanensis TaxID=2607656 RepID=A0A7L4ZVG3_9BACT|nr:DUF4249 domain-containing protein [Hymenobacter busanensis]KAA9332474.1 DUF4249 domain-containing protein [Hymenobacter busanensis]QHJ07188.1 DUF4249 family protein [Hymenobacter busanensis]